MDRWFQGRVSFTISFVNVNLPKASSHIAFRTGVQQNVHHPSKTSLQFGIQIQASGHTWCRVEGLDSEIRVKFPGIGFQGSGIGGQASGFRSFRF